MIVLDLRKNERPGNVTTRGPSWVHSLDGHDKLMGYQSSTFPFATYGCIDSSSRKLLWLRVCTSKYSNLQVTGKWYLELLLEKKIVSAMLKVDKRTDTGTMAAMHSFFSRYQSDMDLHEIVLYGLTTSNQIYTQRGERVISCQRIQYLIQFHLQFNGNFGR